MSSSLPLPHRISLSTAIVSMCTCGLFLRALVLLRVTGRYISRNVYDHGSCCLQHFSLSVSPALNHLLRPPTLPHTQLVPRIRPRRVQSSFFFCLLPSLCVCVCPSLRWSEYMFKAAMMLVAHRDGIQQQCKQPSRGRLGTLVKREMWTGAVSSGSQKKKCVCGDSAR